MNKKIKRIIFLILPWVAVYVAVESFFNVVFSLCMSFNTAVCILENVFSPLLFLHSISLFEIPVAYSANSSGYPWLNEMDKLLILSSWILAILFFAGMFYSAVNLFKRKRIGWNMLFGLLVGSTIINILFALNILKIGVPNPILPIFPFHSYFMLWIGEYGIPYNLSVSLILWSLLSFYLLYQVKNLYK